MERGRRRQKDDRKISARILVGTGHYSLYGARARAGSSIFKKGSASDFLLGLFFFFFQMTHSLDTVKSSEKVESHGSFDETRKRFQIFTISGGVLS